MTSTFLIDLPKQPREIVIEGERDHTGYSDNTNLDSKGLYTRWNRFSDYDLNPVKQHVAAIQ